MLADLFARRSVMLAQRQEEVGGSAVLGPLHRQVGYGAIADEMLAQLQQMCPSGLEGIQSGELMHPIETDDEDDGK